MKKKLQDLNIFKGKLECILITHPKELVHMVFRYCVIPRITISDKFVQCCKKASKNCKRIVRKDQS